MLYSLFNFNENENVWDKTYNLHAFFSKSHLDESKTTLLDITIQESESVKTFPNKVIEMQNRMHFSGDRFQKSLYSHISRRSDGLILY